MSKEKIIAMYILFLLFTAIFVDASLTPSSEPAGKGGTTIGNPDNRISPDIAIQSNIVSEIVSEKNQNYANPEVKEDKSFVDKAVDFGKDVFGKIGDRINDYGKAIDALFNGDVKGAWDAAKPNTIGEQIGMVVGLVASGFLGPVGAVIGMVVGAIIDAIMDIFSPPTPPVETVNPDVAAGGGVSDEGGSWQEAGNPTDTTGGDVGFA